MSTAFEATSPVGSSTTMASASAVSKTFVTSTFHSHHAILSSPSARDEALNLTLSPSSSFLANYSTAVGSNPPKSSIAANFALTAALVSTAGETGKQQQQSMCLDSHHSQVGAGGGGLSAPNGWHAAANSAKLELQNAVVSQVESVHHAQTYVETIETLSGDAVISRIEEDGMTKIREIGERDVLREFDENSSASSSTQSSDNGQFYGRKKRRRGEGQMLMEDLIGIDKSLAADIANDLNRSPGKPCNADASCNSADSADLSVKQQQQPVADEEPKKTKEDSPAFRLRPRRSAKSTSFSGYCSGSGSSSPISIMYSPVKRSKQPVFKKTILAYTQQLLSDTSKQLSQFLNNHQQQQNGHNGTAASSGGDAGDQEKKNSVKPFVRSFAKSILQDVNVSVFADLITPLELTYDFSYPDRYLSLTICEIKPLRQVYLLHPETKDRVSSPLLEMVTIDMDDRFLLDHTKGIFDNATSNHAPRKQLTVYLLGTYALKANEMAVQGQVVNIVKFRSTKSSQIDTLAVQPPKKRKLNLSSEHQYPFGIIVDALPDITSVGEDHKLSSKKELSDSEEMPQSEMREESVFVKENEDHFEEMFKSSPYSELASNSSWVPLVSFSTSWRAPADPRELNRSLHFIQPSIPKFESASRTVKMNP